MSAATAVASLLGTTASGLAAAQAGWWTLLAILAIPPARPGRAASRSYQFVALVPAHNEEELVGACVRSLRDGRGRHDVRVVVVADNCDDTTADVARRAGADVVERHDPGRRGKPYALQFGLDWLADGREPEAVAYVDADTVVDDGFFEAMASRLEGGAEVIQGYYGVLPGDSPVVGLRSLAFALVHWARPLGASRLGLGTSLKGNGMVMTWEVASRGLPAAGITEDAAMSIAYARAGTPVWFEPAAKVSGYMAPNYEEARTQDERWEGGRLGLMLPGWKAGLRLAARGRLADAHSALEAASPPLMWVAGLALSGAAFAALGFGPPAAAVAAIVLVAAYVLVGWTAARVPVRDLRQLASAPRFIAHKGAVWLRIVRRSTPRDWQKTPRASAPRGRTR